MATAVSLFPFEKPVSAAEVAGDHSLLELDQELDFLLEQIENEIEEHGEATQGAMERFAVFCEAMNVKVDRIGRYLSLMETRAAHCKKEAERYAARAKRAEGKIGRTKAMVLYYLASHNLKQLESDAFTLRRQKNSQDSVIVTNPEAIPADLCRFEVKVEGSVWMRVLQSLPEVLAKALQAAVKSSEPSNSIIKQHVANGGKVDGAEVKRLFHLRVV
jgi:hypothetical protein